MTYQETPYQKVYIVDINGNIVSSFGSSGSTDEGSGATTSTTTRVVAATDSPEVVAIGSVGTAAATADTGGFSLLAFFQRLLSVTLAKGQALMSGSLPVAIASDQTAIPVSLSSTPLPTNASQDRITAASPSSIRLSDGTNFFKPTTPADTQPVSITTLGQALSAASVPVVLPAAQVVTLTPPTTVGLNAGSNTIGSINILGGNATAVKVDGSAVSQPVTSIQLPATLGAKTSANSASFVLASDQSSIPVTVSFPATQAVSSTTLGLDASLQSILLRLMPDASSYESIGANVTGTIKASSGRVYAITCLNLNAATRYLQLFDAANNSGTPKRVYPIYGGNGLLVLGQETFGGQGLSFGTQIIFGFSTVAASYTAGASADCILAVRYL